MFKGTYEVSIDSKGRLAVPADFRELLSTQGTSAWVVTLNPWDPCLYLYPVPEWQGIAAKLDNLTVANRRARRTNRVVLGHAKEVNPDVQGRIRIPANLRRYAELTKKAAVLGLNKKLEIWNTDMWHEEFHDWRTQTDDGDTEMADVLRSLSL